MSFFQLILKNLLRRRTLKQRLQDAQNVQVLAGAPWLLSAAAPVILVILAFHFLGDGIRDAADPYG